MSKKANYLMSSEDAVRIVRALRDEAHNLEYEMHAEEDRDEKRSIREELEQVRALIRRIDALKLFIQA